MKIHLNENSLCSLKKSFFTIAPVHFHDILLHSLDLKMLEEKNKEIVQNELWNREWKKKW